MEGKHPPTFTKESAGKKKKEKLKAGYFKMILSQSLRAKKGP